MRIIALIALLAAVGLSFAQVAPSGGNITSCMQITMPGVYNITQDLSGAPINTQSTFGTNTTACIYVTVANVTVDCKGHTITGPGQSYPNDTVGFAVDGFQAIENVSLMNCPSISNFSGAVDYSSCSGCGPTSNFIGGSVRNVTANNDSTYGFIFGHITNLSVIGNTAYSISSSPGFPSIPGPSGFGFGFAPNSLTANFSGNTAHDNSYIGIAFDNDSGFTVSGNTAYNNGFGPTVGSGIELFRTTAFALSNDVAANNSGDGIYVYRSSQNTLNNELAYGNQQDGILIQSYHVTSYNNVTNSTAYNNSNGFELIAEDHILLSGDNAYNNSNDGFLLHADSNNYGSHDNTLSYDNASYNGFDGFEVGSVYDNCCNPVNNRNTLYKDIAHDNQYSGFQIERADYNSIDSSLAYDQNNASLNNAGFYIEGCDSFYCVASYDNITNSEAYGNFAGFVVSHDDNDYLAGDTAHNNNLYGFELISVFNSTLIGDTANNNTATCNIPIPPSSGFALADSSSNNLTGDVAHDNLVYYCPCRIKPKPKVSSVVEPKCYSTSGNGFSISGSGSSSDDNTLYQDQSYSNGDTGVWENQNVGSRNNYTNIDSSNNQLGFSLSGDDSDYLANVTVHDNSEGGLLENTYYESWTTIDNSRFYSNGWEIMQDSGFVGFRMINTTIGLASPVIVSLTDVVDNGGYWINDTTAPSSPPTNRTSFENEYLKVLFAPGETIDNLTFQWQPPGSSFAPSITSLTWNASGNDTWIDTPGQTLDNNSLSVFNLANFTTDDIYGLFWNSTAKPPSGGITVNAGYLVMSKQAVCPGNLLNVTVSTSGNSPAAGASVTVYENGVPVAEGSTGPDGSVLLTLPKSDSYTVNATYSSYSEVGQGFRYALCAGTPACSSDNDCPLDQRCLVNDNPSLNKCVPVQCQCGQSVQNHTCIGSVYQCGSGSNCNACPNGEVCGDNHQCKQAGCSSDASCKDDEACKTATGAPGSTTTPGTCQPLCPDGSSSCSCGQATNHTLVPYGYECGSEPGCQQCQPGFTCNSDHKCVQGDINCPSTAIVGDQKSCAATQNGQPLSNCTVTLTDPSGKTYTGTCDPNGNFQTPPLTVQGVWTVTLLENGTTLKTVQINALPKSAPSEQPIPTAAPGFDLGSLVWLLVLLVIIIAVILYWRGRSGRK